MIKIYENLKKPNDISRLYSAVTTTPLWRAFYWVGNREINTIYLLLITSGRRCLTFATKEFMLLSQTSISGPAQKWKTEIHRADPGVF